MVKSMQTDPLWPTLLDDKYKSRSSPEWLTNSTCGVGVFCLAELLCFSALECLVCDYVAASRSAEEQLLSLYRAEEERGGWRRSLKLEGHGLNNSSDKALHMCVTCFLNCFFSSAAFYESCCAQRHCSTVGTYMHTCHTKGYLNRQKHQKNCFSFPINYPVQGGFSSLIMDYSRAHFTLQGSCTFLYMLMTPFFTLFCIINGQSASPIHICL